jgi:ABC-type phosphate/phosphonate transport system substrate-binding protein
MTALVAAFPMYNRPELRPAFDALWAGTHDGLLAAGVADVPQALTPVETGLKEFWQRPDLLLSQTCGMPFRHVLKGKVTLVGTPDFGLDGCPPGYYRSAIIVRADDPRQTLTDFAGATFACNETLSQSGYAAPLVAAERAGVRFGTQRQSGAHALSARMVAGGAADIAGIDAVSWRHLCRYDPWTEVLRVLTWTEPTPGLPFITAVAPLAAVLQDCLQVALAGLDLSLRDALTLRRIVRIPAEAYLTVSDPQ